MAEQRVKMPDLGIDLAKIGRVSISACGTAYYAGLVAKYWFERYARVPVEIDVASEFRYREAPMEPGGLSIFVSQSGETADTLATLRYCKSTGQRIASVVNVRTSTIARESDAVLPTLAGPEIGVASTKAFTCQLSVLACLAIALGRARGKISAEQERELVHALTEVPRHIATFLRNEQQFEELAHSLSKARDVLYLGRGISFPLALEGALKLKEISYIHAEGYAAGELKHGPIALIDENVPGRRGGAGGRPVREDGLEHAGGRCPRRPDRAAVGRQPRQGRLQGAGPYRDAARPSVHVAADLRRARATARLSHGRADGHGRRPAAQSRQVGNGGIAPAAGCRLRRNRVPFRCLRRSSSPEIPMVLQLLCPDHWRSLSAWRGAGRKHTHVQRFVE